MELLTEILRDVEKLLIHSRDVVELTGLSEDNANYLIRTLGKYHVRRATVMSGQDRSINYTLHISNQ
ncbi:MAG: hypothetical protein AABX50_01090 [Nanoarchaeota archaeon]